MHAVSVNARPAVVVNAGNANVVNTGATIVTKPVDVA